LAERCGDRERIDQSVQFGALFHRTQRTLYGPSTPEIIIGTVGDATFYIGIGEGPSNFGTGGMAFTGTGSGDLVGVFGTASLDRVPAL
jgi:hypothetical protein